MLNDKFQEDLKKIIIKHGSRLIIEGPNFYNEYHTFEKILDYFDRMVKQSPLPIFATVDGEVVITATKEDLCDTHKNGVKNEQD